MSAAVEIGRTTRGKKSLSKSAETVKLCKSSPSCERPDFSGKIFAARKKSCPRRLSSNLKIILCEMNLSAYLSTAREIPAVRTKVIPIDSELNGGCIAAEAINHAADAINKISLNAAEIFATIAGKNFLKFIQSNLPKFA